MLGVERATDRLREHRAQRVHVKQALDAAVHEASWATLLQAEVAAPPNGATGTGVWDAA